MTTFNSLHPSACSLPPSVPRRRTWRASFALVLLAPLLPMLGCDFIPETGDGSKKPDKDELPDEDKLPEEPRFVVEDNVTLCNTDDIDGENYLDAFESKHTISIDPGVFTTKDIQLSGSLATKKGRTAFATQPLSFKLDHEPPFATARGAVNIDGEEQATLFVSMFREPDQKKPTFLLNSFERLRQDGFKSVRLIAKDGLDILGSDSDTSSAHGTINGNSFRVEKAGDLLATVHWWGRCLKSCLLTPGHDQV